MCRAIVGQRARVLVVYAVNGSLGKDVAPEGRQVSTAHPPHPSDGDLSLVTPGCAERQVKPATTVCVVRRFLAWPARLRAQESPLEPPQGEPTRERLAAQMGGEDRTACIRRTDWPSTRRGWSP